MTRKIELKFKMQSKLDYQVWKIPNNQSNNYYRLRMLE